MMARFVPIAYTSFTDERPVHRWINADLVTDVVVQGPVKPLEPGEKLTISKCWRVFYGFAAANESGQVDISSAHADEKSALDEAERVMGVDGVVLKPANLE